VTANHDLAVAMDISQWASALMDAQTTPAERDAYVQEQRRLKQAASDAIAARYREERRQRKAAALERIK
jgi:hypothetical protein